MDWDGDGLPDIIVGDRQGSVNFFRRLPFGEFHLEQQPPVEVGGKPIRVGLNSSPSVFDWNGDGLHDLVVGRSDGVPAGLLLFINEGVPEEPVFSVTDTVTCCGEPVQLYSSYPDFGDLNGDGLEDLIVGNTTGKIPCYVNSGTPDQPLFMDYQELRADGEVIDFLTYVRPSICYWDQDTIPDLLVSTWEGTVHLFLGLPATGIHHDGAAEGPGMVLAGLANPVRGLLRATVTLGSAARVKTSVHSIDGRLLTSRDHGDLPGGTRQLNMDVSGLPAGIYLFVCSVPGRSLSRGFAVLGR